MRLPRRQEPLQRQVRRPEDKREALRELLQPLRGGRAVRRWGVPGRRTDMYSELPRGRGVRARCAGDTAILRTNMYSELSGGRMSMCALR